MELSNIYIYPIKSLAGHKVQESKVTSRGLQYDRRYMLITADGQFMTQRQIPEMALFQTSIENSVISIWHNKRPEDVLELPLVPTEFIDERIVSVWELESISMVMSKSINQWFSRKLDIACQLVYMPDNAERRMKEKYNKKRDLVSFADGAPVLIIGNAALDDLNSRLIEPVPMDRFRPNLVFSGGSPFAEDHWNTIRIGSCTFRMTHLCKRCNVPNINQQTAEIEKEPNRTLAQYRFFEDGIYVGKNAVWEPQTDHDRAVVQIGDSIHILE